MSSAGYEDMEVSNSAEEPLSEADTTHPLPPAPPTPALTYSYHGGSAVYENVNNIPAHCQHCRYDT